MFSLFLFLYPMQYKAMTFAINLMIKAAASADIPLFLPRVAVALNSLLTIKESARLFLSQRACITELTFVTRKLFSLCREVILFQRSSQTLIKQYDGVDNF